MKYLRLFEESNNIASYEEAESLEAEVYEFANNRLAYLIDEGFRIDTLIIERDNYYVVRVAISEVDMKTFYWNDIKMYFPNFLRELNEYYEVDRPEKSSKVPSIKKSNILFISYGRSIRFSIKELLEYQDNTSYRIKLETIRLEIKGRKV
jgi:hypothetical protein